jgi:ABC-type nitrate/sulfonate/bicarbonate transport system substrate-binding protein
MAKVVRRVIALILALLALVHQPAAAQEKTIVMATTGVGSAQQWPIWIAIAKGYFSANQVKMDIIAAPSASAVMQQVTAGSVNLGSGGLSDPIRAIDQGAKITLLRIEAQVPPYSIFAKPTIKSLKELAGKTIMIGGVKDITRIYTERMLEPNGVKPGQFDTVYAGTAASRFAALSSGAVDATILNPPFSFKAQKAGFTNLGQLVDYVKDLPFTGYAANLQWALANKDVVKGFLDGVAKGVDYFYDDANREDCISILQKVSNADRADVAEGYDYYRKLKIFDHRGLVEASQLKNLVEAMKSIGDLDGSTDTARFVDSDIAAVVKAIQ